MPRKFFKKQDCQRGNASNCESYFQVFGGWIWKNFNGPTAIGPFPKWQKTQPNSDGQSMEQRHMNRNILIPKNINVIQFPHQDFAQNLTGTKSFGMVQWNYRTIAFCSDGRRCRLPKFLSNEGCEKEIIDHAWPWMTMDIWVSNLGTSILCVAPCLKNKGGWKVLWHILMPWIWGTPIWILRHGDAMGHIFPRHKQWRPSKRSTSTSRDKQTALGHHLQQWLNIMNRSRFSRYVWPPINHGFSYFWSPNGAGDDWDANGFAQEP